MLERRQVHCGLARARNAKQQAGAKSATTESRQNLRERTLLIRRDTDVSVLREIEQDDVVVRLTHKHVRSQKVCGHD